MKRTLLLILQLFPIISFTRAQAEQKIWERSFSLARNHTLQSIRPTSHGGFILSGHLSFSDTASHFFVLKLDSSGHECWHKILAGSGLDFGCYTIQTTDGGFLAAGTSAASGSGKVQSNGYGGADFHIFRLKDNGDIIWEKIYGGAGDESLSGAFQTSDGDFIIAGSSTSGISGCKTEAGGGAGNDLWILRLSPDGSIVWQRSLGGVGDNFLTAIHPTKNDGVLLGGTEVVQNGDGAGNGIVYSSYDRLVQMSANGKILIDRIYRSNGNNFLSDVQPAPDEGYIIAGFAYAPGTASGSGSEPSRKQADYQMTKLNMDGAVEWQRTYGTADDECLTSLIQTVDNGCILGGYAYHLSRTTDAPKTSVAFEMKKLSATGYVEWQKNIVNGVDYLPCLMMNLEDGDYIIAGCSSGTGQKQPSNLIKLSLFHGEGRPETFSDLFRESAAVFFSKPDETARITHTGGALIRKLYLVGLDGRLVKEVAVNNSKYLLDTSDLPTAEYIIRLFTDRGPQTLKLAVAR